MPLGKVKWFNNAKGYGFIEAVELDESDAPECSADVFVHHSVIQREGYRTLREGEPVRYEMTQGPKGLQATYVQPLPEANGAAPPSEA